MVFHFPSFELSAPQPHRVLAEEMLPIGYVLGKRNIVEDGQGLLGNLRKGQGGGRIDSGAAGDAW